MEDYERKVRCPFCEGHGELTRAEVAAKWTTQEFRKRLDARIAEILEDKGLARVAAQPRNFEREVHAWNPRLPIWRRSPKE
jgi:hypothetical protein